MPRLDRTVTCSLSRFDVRMSLSFCFAIGTQNNASFIFSYEQFVEVQVNVALMAERTFPNSLGVLRVSSLQEPP